MSVYAGPDISTDGLVAFFDAGNNKSLSTNRFISYGTGLTTQNVTFSIQGTGTFQRVAAGTVIGGYTVKPTDVVYSYALGGNGCHYHGNSTPIPAGVRSTFTFDYLVTGATTYPIDSFLANFENYGGGAQSASVSVPNNLQNVWQRISFTTGQTSAVGTQAMFLYPGGCSSSRLADSGTIYFRNPRVEFTNIDSGTENFSSMPNLTTWYNLVSGNNGTLVSVPYHFYDGYFLFDGIDDHIDLGNPIALSSIGGTNNITVSAWVYYTAYGGGGQPYSVITVKGNPWTWLMENPSNTFRFRITAGGADVSVTDVSTHLLNQWYNVVGTYNGTSMNLYVNSVLKNTRSQTGTLASNSITAKIGTFQGTNYNFTGRIANVQVYNRTLSNNEIEKNFNSLRNRYGV
jgi:hypothetical protein